MKGAFETTSKKKKNRLTSGSGGADGTGVDGEFTDTVNNTGVSNNNDVRERSRNRSGMRGGRGGSDSRGWRGRESRENERNMSDSRRDGGGIGGGSGMGDRENRWQGGARGGGRGGFRGGFGGRGGGRGGSRLVFDFMMRAFMLIEHFLHSRNKVEWVRGVSVHAIIIVPITSGPKNHMKLSTLGTTQ